MATMNIKSMIIILILISALIILYVWPITTSSFSELYKKNDSAALGLKSLQNHPLKSLIIEGVKWNYYSNGSGEKCILFIHGMGGTYDLWWNQLLNFESNYKVISYTLPKEINSLEKVDRGISAILAKENVKTYIAVGTSMGGYIAQYLMVKHPENVEKVVMGNTFPPNQIIKNDNKIKQWFLPFLPKIVVAKFFQDKLKSDIEKYSEKNKLLQAFLLSIPFEKQSFTGRYAIVIEHFAINSKDPVIKNIPKMIFESDNDPMISPQLRLDLKKLYPEAVIYTFNNKGHFPYVNDVSKYNEQLKIFIEDHIK